ncbi:MAG: aminotransferase class IV [Desulfuromonadales bacterium]|nr:aminotransferase class IV [Desulfuromonadales bacterium]
MNLVYLNGQFIEEDQACISVLDQGFLYGDGIFESFRSMGGKLYQFPLHYQRLVQSAQALSYPLLFAQHELEQQLLELQNRNQLVNGYFRITITRGLGQIGFLRDMESALTCLIIGKEFKGIDEPLYQQGVPLTVAQTRRNAPEAINPKIKSISNLNSLLGKLEARAAGAIEVIMLNSRGHLCEGSASNLFWVRDGWVFTPDVSTGLLEGVTRSTIMRLCEERLNLRVITGEFRLQDLHYSDEVFITSTSLEVLPVVRVDDFVIGKGVVGPVARDLRRELQRDMGVGVLV